MAQGVEMRYYGSSKETSKVGWVAGSETKGTALFAVVLNSWIFGAESKFQSKALSLWVCRAGLRGSCPALVGNSPSRLE